MGKFVYSIILLLVFSQSAAAQRVTGTDGANEQDDPYEHISYFMAGLNYLSNNVYLGRKDSVTVPYISPYVDYHFKSGIYARVMVTDAPTKNRIDLVTLEAGYDHSFGKHLNAGVSLDKFYYSKNSSSIRASSTASAGIFAQYSNDWIEPQLTFDADFNKKTDFITAIQLDHDFSLSDNKLHIIPIVKMNAGTQHYYDEYFINRLTKKDKTLKLKKVLNEADKYKVLDYEVSAAITYRVNKWVFVFTPTYAIPVSPSTITLPKQTLTEKHSNTFFAELDICYRYAGSISRRSWK